MNYIPKPQYEDGLNISLYYYVVTRIQERIEHNIAAKEKEWRFINSSDITNNLIINDISFLENYYKPENYIGLAYNELVINYNDDEPRAKNSYSHINYKKGITSYIEKNLKIEDYTDKMDFFPRYLLAKEITDILIDMQYSRKLYIDDWDSKGMIYESQDKQCFATDIVFVDKSLSEYQKESLIKETRDNCSASSYSGSLAKITRILVSKLYPKNFFDHYSQSDESLSLDGINTTLREIRNKR